LSFINDILSLSRDSKISLSPTAYEKQQKKRRIQATVGGIVIAGGGVNWLISLASMFWHRHC
jgi:hypothetical protein